MLPELGEQATLVDVRRLEMNTLALPLLVLWEESPL
jgi:hypothetical protein